MGNKLLFKTNNADGPLSFPPCLVRSWLTCQASRFEPTCTTSHSNNLDDYSNLIKIVTLNFQSSLTPYRAILYAKQNEPHHITCSPCKRASRSFDSVKKYRVSQKWHLLRDPGPVDLYWKGKLHLSLFVKIMKYYWSIISVSLQDIHLRKAFRSTQVFDQQVVSRDTMPKAMLEAYLACDTPPPLNKLNPYR